MRGTPARPSRRQFLGLLSGGGAVAVATGLVACTGGGGPAKPSGTTGGTGGAAPTGTGSDLDVTRFGATGDGHTDDTDAIVRALAALATGGTLRFPAHKVFAHSRVITVTTPNARILGPGRLLATDESASSLQIDADGVLVDGLSLGVASTTRRWDAPAQHRLYLGGRSKIVVRDVHIDGSAAAGLFCYGTSELELDGVTVSGTRADGIHMTNGCHDVQVTSPMTSATGDDGVAVVSYLSDISACTRITVRHARVRSTTGGRGMSVVGGSNISYDDIEVNGSNAAGLYIACESGDFVTHPVNDVRVNGGRITDANTNASIDHGAVLVYSGRSDGGVSDVTVSDLSISGTRASASRQIGVVANTGAPVSGVRFEDLQLAATPKPYEGNAPVAGIELTGVTAAGKAVSAAVTR